jgi:thymidylate kinase
MWRRGIFIYLSALAVTSSALKELLAKDEIVLIESFTDRAQAFHLAMGSRLKVNVDFMVKPDLVIVLECNEEVRVQRINARSRARRSYWHDRSERVIEKIRAYYCSLVGAARLDSTCDPDRLLNSATGLCKEYSRG